MKLKKLRGVIGLIVLPIMLGMAAFLWGAFDPLVIHRVRDLSQNKSQEWDNKWYGVSIQQYPTDLMIYQEIIYELKPDLIIETGTRFGGLTLFLATVLENVNPSAKVITVDIVARPWEMTVETHKQNKILSKIEFIAGSSTAPEVIERIAQEVGHDKKVLVILDSLHSKEHVLEELQLYSAFVSVSGYLIVNDTHLDEFSQVGSGRGPMAAVQQFLENVENFRVDHSKNKFILTCSPSGFLKRVS